MWGPSPDLALPAGHPARALDEIIEKLGLERCDRKYLHTAGEPAYSTRGMIKLLVYAYMRGITSSREIAGECEENIAFQFLTRGQCPDFRTIALFRRRKRHLLRWVFKKTVEIAQQMGIARLGLVALDSVKFPADANAGKKMTKEQLNEELTKLDEYLHKAEVNDQKEDGQYGSAVRGDELPADMVRAQQRKEKLEKALMLLRERQSAAKEKPPKEVSIVDPEAPWVRKGGKIVRGYSGQVAADSEHQVIVGLKATAQPLDAEQLNPMLQEIEKTTRQAPDHLVADSGYYSDDAVLEASRSKTDCFVPDGVTASQMNHPKGYESEKAAYHFSKFTYDEADDEFTCPQGKKLPFVKNHYRRGPTKIYTCADCHDCPFQSQCTDHASGFRSLEMRSDHEEVRKIREKLKTETGKAAYKQRKAIIEPIFGRWQHNWGIRRLRLRGLAGFSVELHLLAIAHNLMKLSWFGKGFAQQASARA